MSSVLSYFFARSSSRFVPKTVTCSRSSRTRSSAASSPRGSRAPTCALASIAPPRARPWLSLWSTRARENPPRPPPSKVLVNCNAPGAVATRLLDHVIARGGSLERRVGALGRALLVEWLVPVRSFAWHPRDGSLTSVYCAASDELARARTTGRYFQSVAREQVPARAIFRRFYVVARARLRVCVSVSVVVARALTFSRAARIRSRERRAGARPARAQRDARALAVGAHRGDDPRGRGGRRIRSERGRGRRGLSLCDKPLQAEARRGRPRGKPRARAAACIVGPTGARALLRTGGGSRATSRE